MLCHEYQCIYIHIPKTAGQSIHLVFADLLRLRWKTHAKLLLKANNDPSIGNHHLKAKEYLLHQDVTAEIFSQYFKFSFVRNPWSRLVSEYKFRGHPRHYDFKTFVFNYLPSPSDWDDRYCHIIPMYDFLYDDNNNLLIDFVGRFETLDQDFAALSRILGLPCDKLPHINQKPQIYKLPKNFRTAKRRFKDLMSVSQAKRFKANTFAKYTDYYDDETRDFVATLYKKDIDAFGYTFDGHS